MKITEEYEPIKEYEPIEEPTGLPVVKAEDTTITSTISSYQGSFLERIFLSRFSPFRTYFENRKKLRDACKRGNPKTIKSMIKETGVSILETPWLGRAPMEELPPSAYPVLMEELGQVSHEERVDALKKFVENTDRKKLLGDSLSQEKKRLISLKETTNPVAYEHSLDAFVIACNLCEESVMKYHEEERFHIPIDIQASNARELAKSKN